jgi:ketosteroid isomerase-like protein
MKVLVLLLLLFTQGAHSQDRDIEAIRSMLMKQQSDWNKGNIDAFMEGYWKNDSILFVGSKGVTYGHQNILNNYHKNYSDTVKMGKLTFELRHFNRLGPDAFLVVGKFHLARSIGDASGFFTLTIRRIQGKWLIVADHTS